MHGNNLNSLHQLIHPEILPSELGGMMPPYDMGTWARTLLDHAYDEETDYCPESYTLSVQDLERDLEKNLSPKTMKRSVQQVDSRLTRLYVLAQKFGRHEAVRVFVRVFAVSLFDISQFHAPIGDHTGRVTATEKHVCDTH